jgi:hypothetical protein
MDTSCKNCGGYSEQTFCGSCGQKMHINRFDTKHIFFHEIPHGIIHLDKGFLYTTKALIKRPGHFIREYLEGKRANHYGPIQYVFIIGIIIGLMLSIFKVNTSEMIKNMPNSVNYFKQLENLDNRTDIDVAKKNKLKKLITERIEYSNKLQETITKNYRWIIFLLIPFSALSGFWVTRKLGYNFAENIVRSLYTAGINSLFTIILIPLNLFKSMHIWSSIISLLITLVITGIVWYQFLSKKLPDTNSRIIKIILFWIYFLLLIIIVLGSITFISGIIYAKYLNA